MKPDDVVVPINLEDAIRQASDVLDVVRALALNYRNQLIDEGFSTEDAAHLAVGALYDIQTRLLDIVWGKP